MKYLIWQYYNYWFAFVRFLLYTLYDRNYLFYFHCIMHYIGSYLSLINK